MQLGEGPYESDLEVVEECEDAFGDDKESGEPATHYQAGGWDTEELSSERESAPSAAADVVLGELDGWDAPAASP